MSRCKRRSCLCGREHGKFKGRIVLAGSQTYELMRSVSKSLAGRIGILEMSGLSLREVRGLPGRVRPYVPAKLKKGDLPMLDGFDLWATI